MVSRFQRWLGLPTLGLAIALVVTVIGARLTTDSANLLLGIAWILATISLFSIPSIGQLNIIPRILCTLLFSSIVGLALHQLKWEDSASISQSNPTKNDLRAIAKAPVPGVSFLATTTAAEYAEGTMLKGIRWNRRYAPLNITILNASPTDAYSNLELVLAPHLAVRHAVYETTAQGVTIEPAVHIMYDFEVVRSDSKQRFASPAKLFATDAGYRLRCPRLGPGEHIDVLLVVVRVKEQYKLGEDYLNKPGFIIRVSSANKDGTNDRNHYFIRADVLGDPDVALGDRVLPTTLQIGGSYLLSEDKIDVSETIIVRDYIGENLPQIEKDK